VPRFIRSGQDITPVGTPWIVVRTLLVYVGLPILLVTLAFVGGIHATVGVDEAVRLGNDRLGDIGPSERTMVVGIDASGADRRPVAETRAALEYWERQEAASLTGYDAEFLLRPDATDPDVLIRYRPGVSCSSGRPACAIRVRNEETLSELPRPLLVRIDSAHVHNRRGATYLLKHELGHIRGLAHCVEPRVVMGCPHSADGEGRSWKSREHAWAKPTVRVYVPTDTPNATATDVWDALARIERSADAPTNLSFVSAGSAWEADLVVEARTCGDCPGRYEMRFRGGRHYDDDGDAEFLTYAEVDVVAPDGAIEETVYEPVSELALRT
jgi:hypothetical protein